MRGSGWPSWRGFVQRAIGPFRIMTDHSWPHGEANVTEVETRDGHFIVKEYAADKDFRRELAAYRWYLHALKGHRPDLAAVSDSYRLLVSTFLEGTLVQDHPGSLDPAVHREAGRLLRLLHQSVDPVPDARYGLELLKNYREWAQHGKALTPGEQLEAAEKFVRPAVGCNAALVPTHGDYSPRNWTLHGKRLAIIDFGKVQLRPWCFDLARLTGSQWQEHPALQPPFSRAMGGLRRTERIS